MKQLVASKVAEQTWILESVSAPISSACEDGWYYIQNGNTLGFMTLEVDSTDTDVNVVLKSDQDDAGKWYVKNLGNGYITLVNSRGKSLNVYGNSSTSGANILVNDTKVDAKAQIFYLKGTSIEGTFTMLTKASNLECAVMVDTNNNNNVRQYTHSSSDNIWTFIPTKAPENN